MCHNPNILPPESKVEYPALPNQREPAPEGGGERVVADVALEVLADHDQAPAALVPAMYNINEQRRKKAVAQKVICVAIVVAAVVGTIIGMIIQNR